MTDAGRTGDATAQVVLGAVDRLIGDLADAVPPFAAVGDALAQLADGLGVEKVIVAVDDPQLGRQVFCSRRAPLGEQGMGLIGPRGAWTQPPRRLDAVATAILLRAVDAGVKRASSRRSPRALPQETGAIDAAIAVATARAVRHGWGFTLVLVRGEPGIAQPLRERLRASDLLVAGDDDRETALLLPQTAGDRVPFVLTRLSKGAGVPPFSYGLASCPADGTDPFELRRSATERLEEAVLANANAQSTAAS